MSARNVEVVCSVPGCGHPAQGPGDGSGYCVAHTGLLWRFARWIDGNPGRDVLSFDRDRSALEHGTWHPV